MGARLGEPSLKKFGFQNPTRDPPSNELGLHYLFIAHLK